MTLLQQIHALETVSVTLNFNEEGANELEKKLKLGKFHENIRLANIYKQV